MTTQPTRITPTVAPICYENYKARKDHTEGLRLWPSEIGWQSFMMASTDDNVPLSNLGVIVQDIDVEEQTKMVPFRATRMSTHTRSGPNDCREYAKIDNGYF